MRNNINIFKAHLELNKISKLVINFIFMLVMISFFGNILNAQTFSLQKSVSNTNPNAGVPFNYIIDAACNSTTRDCETAVITDCLPPEVEFLNVSNPLPDGVSSATYDPNTHCVTIRFDATACASCTPDGINTDNDDFAQGSTIQLAIQVRFPTGTFSGTTANNTANGTSTNAGNPSDSAPTVTAGGTTAQTGCSQVEAYANLSNTEVIQGGQFQVRVRAYNLGTSNLTNYSITSSIPNGATFEYLRGPGFPNGHTQNIDIYYERSDNPGNFIFWGTISTVGEQRLYASALGLPAGVTITSIRSDWGTLSGDGTWNPSTWTDPYFNELKLIGSTDSNLPVGTNLNFCNDVSANAGSASCNDIACIQLSIVSGEPLIHGYKQIQDLNGVITNTVAAGERFKVALSMASLELNNTDIVGGYMLDILPPCIQYVPNSWQFDWGFGAVQNQNPLVNHGTLTDGREYVEFIWDNTLGNEFTIPANGTYNGFAISFEVIASNGCTTGSYLNEMYFGPTGSTQHECSYGKPSISPTLVNSGSYISNGKLCESPTSFDIVRPPGSAGLESYKEVLGTKDNDYHRYPNVGETVPGGLNDYRICLTNPNSTPVDEIVIIDILPKIGDTEVLDPSVQRNSEWEPILSSPISAPSGITVQYTTVNNPCRNELASPGDPLPYPSGCSNPNWSIIPPSDLADVTAVRFDFGSTTLNQGDEVCIEWDMRAPIGAPTDGSIAWNSFAYAASNATTGDPLLPAEPIKVGIALVPGTVPIKGDFVWEDSNGNGIQDAGEPGIDGVRVNLFRDSDNDGIAETNSDQLYTYTVTQAGGQYIFSDFPTGNYFIEFTDLPTGYNPTHSNVGTNEAIDSDGLIIGPFTVTSTTDNKDCDLGIYPGTPPPLVPLSCTTSLVSSETCNANDGSVTVSADGGTGVYFYQWNTGSTNNTISGLASGNYFVTVSDSGGNTTTCNYYVPDDCFSPECDDYSLVVDAWSCSTACDGTAPICGLDFASTTDACYSDIASFTDPIGNAGCFNQITIALWMAAADPSYTRDPNAVVQVNKTYPIELNGVQIGTIDPVELAFTCNVCDFQVATFVVNPEDVNYIYGGINTLDINFLEENTPTFTQAICIAQANLGFCMSPGPTCNITNPVNVSCNGLSNGSATVSAISENGGYSYLWDNNEMTATAVALNAGDHFVTVTDNFGCEDVCSVLITEPATLNCSINLVKYVECNCRDNGQANVVPEGGTAPYSYSWDNGETTQTATTLSLGPHTVTVTDAQGCQTTCNFNMEKNPNCCITIKYNGFIPSKGVKN